MRNWLIWFAVAACMMRAQAGAQQTESKPADSLPGRLDSFLTANPSATLATRFLGRLTGLGDVWDQETNLLRKAEVTATLSALLASLRSDPTVKVKGLEVRIEYLGNHGEQRLLRTIYIDEEVLWQFEYGLGDLLQLELYLQHHHPSEYGTESEHPTGWIGASVAYLSTAAEDQGDEWRRRKAFSAGWYWKVDAAGDGPVGRVCLEVWRWPGGQFYFPKATLEQLIEMATKGRAFLEQSPPGR